MQCNAENTSALLVRLFRLVKKSKHVQNAPQKEKPETK
jgi:hypothetical protein